MNKHLFLIALLLTCIFPLTTTLGQSPEKMSYQTVIRNSSNSLVASTSIGMQISLLQYSASGTAIYVERQFPTTNSNGLVSIEIGTGNVISGSFSTIDWAKGPYFIKTETDLNGGSTYTITSTSQLLSVPYALHAKIAETVTGGIIETDPLFVASPANEITSADIVNWNNKLEVEQDSSVTNEIQALSISNDTVFLSNGGFVKLPAGFDGQYSSLTGVPTNVSTFANDAGYLTSEKDSSVTNEIQALSISNDTVFLSNGGFVKLSAGFDGQYNSLSGKPTNVSTFINDAGYLTREKDSSITNEIQVLSISNDTVFLSNGGFVKLPFDGQYSSLKGVPSNLSTFSNDAGYLISEKDSSITNEIQALSISNDTVFLSNGGFVKLPVNHYISNDTLFLSNIGFKKLPATHYIGEFYGGGVIFHLWKDSAGVEHGLIVALTDQSTSQAWSNVFTLIGPSAQSRWDGLSNSNAIVGQAGHKYSAAKLCLDLVSGGQSDWYLPSIQELTMLWDNYYTVARTLSQIVGATQIKSAYYWSSTEHNINNALSFFYRSEDHSDKIWTFYVRAVRAF